MRFRSRIKRNTNHLEPAPSRRQAILSPGGTIVNARRFSIHFVAAFAAAVGAAALTGAAAAGSASAPENLVAPRVTGIPKVGTTLTASPGGWAGSPTSFVFKWQRCDSDGTRCGKDLQASAKKTYTVAPGDVDHSIRVVVTAVNGDGRSEAAPSEATDVVSSKDGPKSTAPPAISGDATVGEQLTVTPGTWAPAGASQVYHWQRCDAVDVGCRNILLARSATYTVRSSDIGSKLRVLVTAKSASGHTSIYSGYTDYVQSDVPPTKVNEAPRLSFLSLIRIGRRVYARFRVCDDGVGRITVVERDTKAGALAYTRRYSVYTYASCGTFSRSWTPAPRFRTRGRMTVTLQAIDKSQRKSTVRAKSVHRR
jgi:hypothetical protein